DGAVHESVAQRPGARSELLPPSVCSVCRWYMILDHFTCQGNKIAERKSILSSLERIIDLPTDRAAMELSADALDAAICVLAGYDFLRTQAYPPDDPELARHEGWIWVRGRTRTIVGRDA